MAHNIKNKIAAFTIVLLGLLIGLGISYAPRAAATTLRTVQTPTIHLYTGQTAGATTMRVTPYPKDLNGVKLTYADFGDSPSLTVDPKISGVEEIEIFTGITDNGDGTATLTGMTRNLNSKSPYTTGGTGRTHGAGATVVFGNNPQLYARLAAPENIQSWTAIQTYASTTMPRYDVSPSASQWAAATGKEFVDLNKLNLTAIAGAANSSEIQNGIGQIANRTQMASSTQIGSSGGILLLAAYNATSSFTTATSSVVITRSDGKISPQAIATTSTDNYVFGGAQTFNATTTFNKSSISGVNTITDAATSTLDWDAGNTAYWVLGGNRGLAFTNVRAGMNIRLFVCQDGTGTRTLSIPSTSSTTIRYASGFAPTLTTTAGKCDIFALVTATSSANVFIAATTNF